jgi:hypothetical protein
MTYDEASPLLQTADIRIFEVPTSTTPGDKTTLLQMQNLVRTKVPSYIFLEIGSYRGGALVPHLLDKECARVISIDKRPPSTPDSRAISFAYEGVTTAQMRGIIAPHVPSDAFDKLITLDADVSEIERTAVDGAVDFAFIDGEHTNTACFSDFLGVYPFLAEDSVTCFHDANLVMDALINIRRFLAFINVKHKFFLLPDLMAAVACGEMIGPVTERFGAVAFEETSYIRQAKRELHEQIAGAVRAGAHV